MKKTLLRRPADLSQGLTELHPVLNRIYSARGVTQSEQLERELSGLLPYETLRDIDKAVSRLVKAIQDEQRLLIIGDYDADGATSTAVAVSALRLFKAKHVDYLVPNRFEFGYGLSEAIVEVAIAQKAEVIITVDNGIANVAGVARANLAGIDVVITDHHLAGDELPAAHAIVNPNQPNCPFPCKNLAGVGVIFYVMLALRRALVDAAWFESQGIATPNMGTLLDLVALGTVADVVPLDQVNRILVHQGLQRIRQGRARPGIVALLNSATRSPENLVSSDLAFSIAPRLNAAGRLDDMTIGIECLLSDDLAKATEYASVLQELNSERRLIEADMKQQAFRAIERLQLNEKNLPLGLALYDESWHQGVIGIVAGRVKDRWYRPTIAFADDKDGLIKGSARSIPGVHIRDVLASIASQHPTLITKFGGHAMAAGLSLYKRDLKQFQDAFNTVLGAQITEADLKGVLHSDGELSAQEFTLSFAQMLRDAGPWGQLFPEPLFDGEFEIIEQRLLGGKHLKCVLRLPGHPNLLDAIAFNVEENVWPNHRARMIKIAYKLDINYFRGDRILQLCIEHLEVLGAESQEMNRAEQEAEDFAY